MKMLPILVLTVVCGVLAQNVQGQSFSQISVNISPERFQQMITARMDKQAWKSQLQNLPLQEGLKSNMGQGGGAKGFLGVVGAFGGLVNNVMGNILGLQIKKVELLKIDLRFDDIQKKIFVTFPADLEVQLKMPLNMGNLIHIKIFLDLQVGVLLHKDPSTGNMRLVLGNCQNNPGHIRITLFDNNQPIFKAVNNILGSITNIFEKIIPNLLQKQNVVYNGVKKQWPESCWPSCRVGETCSDSLICPLANGLLQVLLNILHSPVPKAAHGESIQLSANSFDISGGSMRIDYQGSIQANGGGTYVIPPSFTPLPSVPLGDSSMNIIMSTQLVSAFFLSEMPAQTISIENGPQVAEFEEQLAAIRGFSLPAGTRIQTLQMSYGSPSIHLNSGKIDVLQDFGIKVFGNRRGASQLLVSITGKITSVATVSVNSGKMIFTLSLERISSLSLEESLVGTFQVRYIHDAVFQLLNTRLIPHENRLLSPGYTLPMVEGLETEQFQVAAGEDSLVLYTGEQQMETTETTVEWITWEEIPAEP